MEKELNNLYLGIGSNIYPRMFYIYQSLNAIEKNIGKIQSISSIYQTEPWNMSPDTAFFYNLSVYVKTTLKPNEVLDAIIKIEESLGRIKHRQRKNFYQSRRIDIDILLYNDIVMHTEQLIIPHPLMHQRLFVLKPLSEIASNVVHPVLNKTIKSLLG